MTQIQTYVPSTDGCDSVRKANERILTRYAAELLPPFHSKIFGTTIKADDSCIESAEDEELCILKLELESYFVNLKSGMNQLRAKSAELGIEFTPRWCADKYQGLKALAIGIEVAAHTQRVLRKQERKVDMAQQIPQDISPAKRQKKLKAEQHAIHQAKAKAFNASKRGHLYRLITEIIGEDAYVQLRDSAHSLAEAELGERFAP